MRQSYCQSRASDREKALVSNTRVIYFRFCRAARRPLKNRLGATEQIVQNEQMGGDGARIWLSYHDHLAIWNFEIPSKQRRKGHSIRGNSILNLDVGIPTRSRSLSQFRIRKCEMVPAAPKIPSLLLLDPNVNANAKWGLRFLSAASAAAAAAFSLTAADPRPRPVAVL